MTSSQPITILLAEDHTIVRQGLCRLLTADGHFAVIGQARTGREAVSLAQSLRPDVILMDIAMPELNGLEATRRILSAEPTAKVIILSAHGDDAYVRRMNEVGVVGFLEKQTSAVILAKAILEVARGSTFFSPSIVRRPRDDSRVRRAKRDGLRYAVGDRLSSRESEVLQRIAEGSANKQIAAELALSIKTVETYRKHLMEKLEIHGTAALTRYAIAAGTIESSGSW